MDVLFISGGVSVGDFDYVPLVLQEMGFEILFTQLSMKPGKHTLLAKKDDKFVLGFPGNPVSTFVSCLKYFYPWYCKSVDRNYMSQTAILTEDFSFKPNLYYFLQVKLTNKEGQLFAKTVAGKGSGDLANLIDSDAFLELPANRSNFNKGEVFPILTFRK